MSDIRFNQWLHQSGTGGVSQVDGGHVGIGTTNPDIAVHTANTKKINVGIVTANSVYAGNFYGDGSNLTGLSGVSVANQADDRLITATGTSNALNAESSLTYNSGGLVIGSGELYLNDSIIHGGNTPTKIRFPSVNTISMETNGSERFRIDSNGNMGLGTLLASDAGSAGAGLKIEKYVQRNNIYAFPDGYYGASLGEVQNTENKVWASIDSHYSRSSAVSAGIFLSAFHADAGGSGCGAAIKNLKAGNALTFSTVTTGASVGSVAVETERLRIASDGKIATGTAINTSNTYEFSLTGADGTGGFYAHGRNHYLSNRSNAYASLTLKKSNADSDGTDYLQLRDSSNTLKLSISGDGSINGNTVTKLKVAGNEKVRINANSLWVNSSGMPSSSSGAKLQVGAHTFAGNNYAYHESRLGIQNNGSLTCISNCSTYTDVTYPGYGFIMVQGASTSDYNTFGICPDSPQTGSDLNFHMGYRKSNIHSDSGVRQMWINFSGQVYKRDNGANWNQTSDERLKKNIVDNNIGLAEIKQLRITSFEYRKADEIDMSLFPKANDPLQVIIEGEEGPHTGVIAQEIESVLPECVKTSDKGAKTVQADAITWALVNAVKELSAKNDALEERIKNLEGS